MILFRPEHMAPILAGTKTQTRRLGKKRWNVGTVHLAKTRMLSKECFARLEILAVYRERLFDISDEDANAEGYPDAAAYFCKFTEINKLPYLQDIDVWVVVFKVVA